MADDTTMTPVEGAEPPKANPLAKPASSSSTLKLKPLDRPGTPTASGLKLPPKPGLSLSGLKLPPKPGLPTAGLKLPPKPGLPTSSGLKLPPKPGLPTSSGLKLPPKPVEAAAPEVKPIPPKPAETAAPEVKPIPPKPAETAAPAAPAAPAAKPLPKPGLPTAGLKLPKKPGLPTAGLKLPTKPGFSAAGLKLPSKPGLAAGLKLPSKPGLPTQTGLKPLSQKGLATQTGVKPISKPLIRKPGSTLSLTRPTLPGATKTKALGAASDAATIVKTAPTTPAAPAAAPLEPVAELTPVTPTEVAPLEALKSATQNMKSVTAPIPQQAILRKTGIIAEDKSEAQKQAAKSKTSRISLSEAMGAAPVQNESAPMKTIRIKRPIDIPGATKAPTEAAAAEPDTEAQTKISTTPGAAASAATAPAAEPGVSLTQRKTLKIARPSGGVRPSGKFGIKRPGTMMASKPSAVKPVTPSGAAAKPAAEGAPADEVKDIPDIPAVVPTAPIPKATVPGEKPLPKGFSISSIIIQVAACATMGVLAWWLYNDTQILPF